MTDKTTTIRFDAEIDEADMHYLTSSARIRRVSRGVLLGAIIEVIMRDQLILSILDDDSQPLKLNRPTRVPAPSVAP